MIKCHVRKSVKVVDHSSTSTFHRN